MVMTVIIMEMVNDNDGDSNNDTNYNDSHDDNNNNSNDYINNNNGRGLSNLQFNFHHKLPLESLSKWLKS